MCVYVCEYTRARTLFPLLLLVVVIALFFFVIILVELSVFSFWLNLCLLASVETEIIGSAPLLWTIVCNNKPSNTAFVS